MRNFLLVFFLSTVSMHCQSISGIVSHFESKKPVIGASVYFDGSSFGTITDENGAFSLDSKLESTVALIISHIGFSSVIVEHYELAENLEIEMMVEAYEIPEVIIVSDPFTRELKLELFRKEFLGDSKESQYCSILNEDAIGLYFNTTNNKLSVHASEPLIIENQFLGYRINYDLKEFQVSFRTKSLKRLDNIITTLTVGHTFFEDFAANNSRILVRRKKVYKGSIQHLMRNIWNQDWSENKFKVKLKNKSRTPQDVFKVSEGTALENKRVDVPAKKMDVIFKKVFNYRSTLTMFGQNYFYVDKYGNFFPNKQIIIGGHFSTFRISEMLPSDYLMID